MYSYNRFMARPEIIYHLTNDLARTSTIPLRDKFAAEVALDFLTENEQRWWLEGAKLFDAVYTSSLVDYEHAVAVAEEFFPGFGEIDDKLERTTMWLLNASEG
jgi:hypothetical protein